MNSITILGGGYAGTVAAARIARRGVPVTLVDMRDGLVERIAGAGRALFAWSRAARFAGASTRVTT